MSKFKEKASKTHPRQETSKAQMANKGKPTPNKNVKPLSKNQKYSGTT